MTNSESFCHWCDCIQGRQLWVFLTVSFCRMVCIICAIGMLLGRCVWILQSVTLLTYWISNRFPSLRTYTISGGAISWKSLVRYLGVYINSKLTWSDHCKLTASKATKILNVLCRTIRTPRTYVWVYLALAKDMAYWGIVRPCVEYACVVWNLHTAKDCALLDTVQNRGARWIWQVIRTRQLWSGQNPPGTVYKI